MEKFKNVGMDEDTKLKEEKIIKYKDIDVLYQKWVWEAIIGNSLIFVRDDIKNLDINNIVNEMDIIKNKKDITTATSKTGEYLFINFDFEVM